MKNQPVGTEKTENPFSVSSKFSLFPQLAPVQRGRNFETIC